jgi:hypothetical protein
VGLGRPGVLGREMSVNRGSASPRRGRRRARADAGIHAELGRANDVAIASVK